MGGYMLEKFEKGAKDWDSKPRRIKLAKDICEAVKSRIDIKQGSRITDFGTGTGLILLGLSDGAGSLTGLDFSEGMLSVLREKAQTAGIDIKTRVFDIDNDDFEPEAADIITSSMVTHHLKNPEILFEKAYKGLASGGTLCVADLFEEDGFFHDEASEGIHHNGFSAENVRSMFEKAGFKDIIVEPATVLEKERGGITASYRVFLGTGVK